ncbi:MAG: small, acid-soluble spore protein, alpha/beta type [Anaerovoracaceae bacterium]
MSVSNKLKTESKAGLDSMKSQVASELGLTDYENMDKGKLTARENGYVGGSMTKKLVEMAEQQLSGK